MQSKNLLDEIWFFFSDLDETSEHYVQGLSEHVNTLLSFDPYRLGTVK